MHNLLGQMSRCSWGVGPFSGCSPRGGSFELDGILTRFQLDVQALRPPAEQKVRRVIQGHTHNIVRRYRTVFTIIPPGLVRPRWFPDLCDTAK